MSKIVALSDTHRERTKLPKADILIFAGDDDINSTSNLLNLKRYLISSNAKIIIVVAGNHDFYLEKIGKKKCKQFFSPIIYLEDDVIDIEGIKIYGSPWSPKFNDWAFMKERGDDISNMWNNIPLDIDILITHGPPMRILDDVGMLPVGCFDLRRKVDMIKPKYHIFGHVHEGYGKEKLNKTTFMNVSICDKYYNPVNKLVEVEE
jgi:Icc-related predicted phosphoesterase